MSLFRNINTRASPFLYWNLKYEALCLNVTWELLRVVCLATSYVVTKCIAYIGIYYKTARDKDFVDKKKAYYKGLFLRSTISRIKTSWSLAYLVVDAALLHVVVTRWVVKQLAEFGVLAVVYCTVLYCTAAVMLNEPKPSRPKPDS